MLLGTPDIANGNLNLNLRQGKLNFYLSGGYNQSGGRARSEIIDGCVVDAGAQLFGSGFESLFAFARAVGAGDLLEVERADGKRSLIPFREPIARLEKSGITLDPEFLA